MVSKAKVNSPLPSVTKAIGYLKYFAQTSTWEGHIKTSGPMLVPNPFNIIWLKTLDWDLTMWRGQESSWRCDPDPGDPGAADIGERETAPRHSEQQQGITSCVSVKSDSNIAHNYHVQLCPGKQGMLTNPNWNVTNEEGWPSPGPG